MKVKGMKFAIFSALKRNADNSKLSRAEEDRLTELINMRDSQSMQRLKIYLSGKEQRMKYGAFSWWVSCTAGGAQHRLTEQLAAKQKAREEMEARLRDLDQQLRGGSAGRDLESSIRDTQDRLVDAQRRADVLARELEAAKQRLKQAEATLQQQQEARRQDKANKSGLVASIKQARLNKEALEAEFALIVDQIGFLNTYSQ
jgi:hypothetical protein